MYISPVAFGRYIIRRWSVLPGVYIGRRKRSHPEKWKTPAVDSLTLEKENSETNPQRNNIIGLC